MLSSGYLNERKTAESVRGQVDKEKDHIEETE
jgi:hypothetical protein